MKLNNKPDNVAILSNVNDIGEFKIKNSAKAFGILSSGLYANKIRAIVRELSCNALDSHVAAGKGDVPFEVHLPTYLNPYFSVRDFGTGLTHDQVVNIYTTYFESTKTDSNDFIGALGLGSKSPFSYTENFTVTAIRDGIKGIYSAFINNQGVPAIAKMADVETDESNGVEVKFAVENSSDFRKFIQEAETVYSYFAVAPTMTGAICSIKAVEYDEVNVIPGVNVMKQNRNCESVAVMGNIAYPISIPNSDSNLGYLKNLLEKNLEIRFEIGELEFQASREGLSYTKDTILAIKNKLQDLQNKIDAILFAEADAITNKWDRAEFLVKKSRTTLWIGSIKNYKTSKKFDLIDVDYGVSYNSHLFTEAELEKSFNIKISAFIPEGGKTSTIKLKSHYDNTTRKYINVWQIDYSPKSIFVKAEKFRGALEQSKYHFRSAYKYGEPSKHVYILSQVNKDIPCDFDGFFKTIENPPNNKIIKQSDLDVKPREERYKSDRPISILKLKRASQYDQVTWETVEDFKNIDNTKPRYYVPLRGFQPISLDGYTIDSIKELYETILNCGISVFSDIDTIYGVRKADIDSVKTHTNWINIQDHIISTLSTINKTHLESSYLKSKFKHYNGMKQINSVLTKISTDSLYYKINKAIDFKSDCITFSESEFSSILEEYAPKANAVNIIKELKADFDSIKNTYPLLFVMDSSVTTTLISDYINLIDKTLKMEKI